MFKYLSTKEQLLNNERKLAEAIGRYELVVEALGGIKTETVQSDKIGYDFNNVYVGETLVRQEYVQQENPTGTEDNPIEYADGVPLINNAFYLKDGKKYVYMDGWVEW